MLLSSLLPELSDLHNHQPNCNENLNVQTYWNERYDLNENYAVRLNVNYEVCLKMNHRNMYLNYGCCECNWNDCCELKMNDLNEYVLMCEIRDFCDKKLTNANCENYVTNVLHLHLL